MTIAVAATLLLPEGVGFFLTADARTTMKRKVSGPSHLGREVVEEEHADTAIKTYAVSPQVGATGSGDAVSYSSAIEMTRGIVARRALDYPHAPYGYIETLRILAYFLDKIDRARDFGEGCEVVLTGFLKDGRPAIAKIRTTKLEPSRVDIYTHMHQGSLVLLAGTSPAKAQLISQAFAGPSASWPARVAASIWYLGNHQGHSTIGGGVAIAVCPRGESIFWPLVEIAGSVFLRGLNISELPPEAFANEHRVRIDYSEERHAQADQSQAMPPLKVDEGFLAVTHLVEQWIPPQTALAFVEDPPELTSVEVSASHHVVFISRSLEVPGYPEFP